MKDRFKQLFFALYNVNENAKIITFFNYIAIDKLLDEHNIKSKPEIFGRLYYGDYRIIPQLLNELNIAYKEKNIENEAGIKRKYTINRKLDIDELHKLREMFLNNRVMLLPPDARLHDRLEEFGEVENMNPISKFLRIIPPIHTTDIDFHNISGVTEGETYINEEHEKNFSKIPVLPSIFEMKKTDYNKINKDSYKSQIIGLAKYTKEIPIILVVLSSNCEITFFRTKRNTGEIILDDVIRLVESGKFETDTQNHENYAFNNLSKVIVYHYKGSEPASSEQKELFLKIYKELTETGERES